MSELEQLRKEVNELRERIAKLEGRQMVQATPNVIPSLARDWQAQPAAPFYVPPAGPGFPPGTIIC